MNNDLKRREWEERVQEWQGSGESQAAFCEKRGLKIKSFVYWRTKIREAQTNGFIAVKPAHDMREKKTLVEIKVMADGSFVLRCGASAHQGYSVNA
jgi:hypothetical protein